MSGNRGGTLLGLMVLVVTACAGPLEPGAVGGSELSVTGGCADATMYAATGDDRHLVVVRWEGAATRAFDHGPYDEEVTLPDDGVEVELQVGEELAERVCTDIIDPQWPDIEERWTAVSGDARLEVTLEGDDHHALQGHGEAVATVTLRDVAFEPSQGSATEAWHIERVSIPDAHIGWYPG